MVPLLFCDIFEWDSKNETLEIHGNREGLERLNGEIALLLAKLTSDHIHLMTKEWGGNELSNEKQCSENEIIHHVKLFNWVQQTNEK